MFRDRLKTEQTSNSTTEMCLQRLAVEIMAMFDSIPILKCHKFHALSIEQFRYVQPINHSLDTSAKSTFADFFVFVLFNSLQLTRRFISHYLFIAIHINRIHFP